MIVAGGVAPALFGLVDNWLFAAMEQKPQGGLGIVWLFTVFVVQVGVLGVLAARLIELPPLRWAIYAWCWLLIDVQALTASQISSLRYDDSSILLVNALFAAQVGVILMWGILGTTRWQLRLPAIGVLAPVLAMPLFTGQHHGMTDLSQLSLAQLIALGLICGLLRWQRFQLAPPPQPPAAEEEPAPPSTDPAIAAAPSRRRRDLKLAQFGIRHVLIWTTSLAFSLGLLRLLGLLSIPGLSSLLNSELLGYATAGTLIAIVLVVALWAGLGAGPFYLRWPGLAITCLAVGVALIYFEHRRMLSGPWRPVLLQDWFDIVGEFWYWLAWPCLAGALLFATLLMFRTLGHRLVRQRKVESVPD
jgi:hypothetical protein